MKNIFKLSLLAILFSSVLVSCVDDEDTSIPRLSEPFYKETFETNFPNWVKYSKTGAEVWTLDPRFGKPKPNGESTAGAKMSGFANGSSNANEDWLISPAQDFSTLTKAKLSFDNAYNFTGPAIEVYVSNNYTGAGNPEVSGVTWRKIEGAVLSTGGYVWKNSGRLDITDFTGIGNETVYIAFKYTSTASASSTWEIDNVKVSLD